MLKVDVVLHCGDLTNCGGLATYKKALKMLHALNAELKLVISGNHDLDLDKTYWNTHLEDGDKPEDLTLYKSNDWILGSRGQCDLPGERDLHLHLE